ncbi:MAG TPA: integrase arm-type DNA-binding domain-containing protein [Thermoanaerobaculia bacterium]|nr:integrase arm-type DNA-binding domain-containing protein [Thermoanaerobaculia bacterium]
MPTVDKLTDKAVRALKTTKAQEDIWDASRPGFYVRVYPSGAKSFCFSYYSPSTGKKTPLALGRFDPENPVDSKRLTLAEAVERWRAASGKVAQGIDPKREGIDLEADPNGPPVVQLLARVPKERHAQVIALFGDPPLYVGSFGELARDYLVQHAWVEKRRTRDDEQMLARDLLPPWRNIPIRDIRREDVIRLTGDIVRLRRAPRSAEHVRLLVSRVFNFGIAQARAEMNPAQAVRIPGGKTKVRDRWLSEDELRTLWHGLDRRGAVMAGVIRMQILLWQRSGEVSAMEWSEIQGEWWTIPGTKTIPMTGRVLEVGTKNKLPHLCYLPPMAREILETLRPLTGERRFVFQTPKLDDDQPIWYTFKGLSVLSKQLGLASFGRHALRKTGTVNAQRMGVPAEVIDAVVNHVAVGVRKHYNLYAFRVEKESVMLRWEGELRRILGLLEAAPAPNLRVDHGLAP